MCWNDEEKLWDETIGWLSGDKKYLCCDTQSDRNTCAYLIFIGKSENTISIVINRNKIRNNISKTPDCDVAITLQALCED